ncbi:MAG: flagellar protein [Lachnospiraceae bacterium]|nr:flagellar protein [Lachnospiraceae bacterium]MDE6697913.1 flagellar protein [Lachnospiraceae bacterium]
MEVLNKFSPVSMEQIANQYLNKNNNLPVNTSDKELSFKEVLKQKQELSTKSELRFSKHASERLTDRNISLTAEQFERLENGAKRAEAKGINESLMIMDDLAFIVNVKNNTVITALDQKSGNGNVFTNIDGAVIV